MKELANHELDERLQKPILQAREALKKGGVDYVVQVCSEILKNNPSAFEVRALLWESSRTRDKTGTSGMGWLKKKSGGVQFKVSTRALEKKDPLELVHRCDDALRRKQIYPEVFQALEKAGQALGWLETRILACEALVDLEPEKAASRLALARILVEAKRPQLAIDHIERVLAREPANGEAQTLLKDASVAETLQRGNWEDTQTSFHSKAKDSQL